MLRYMDSKVRTALLVQRAADLPATLSLFWNFTSRLCAACRGHAASPGGSQTLAVAQNYLQDKLTDSSGAASTTALCSFNKQGQRTCRSTTVVCVLDWRREPGIGRALALALAERNCHRWHWHLNAQALAETAALARAKGVAVYETPAGCSQSPLLELAGASPTRRLIASRCR